MKVFQRTAPRRILLTVACLFLFSGFIRLGTVGLAVAKDADVAPQTSMPVATKPAAEAAPVFDELLERIATRTKELDEREAKIRDREAKLDLAGKVIEKNLARLEKAEASLRATVSQVDGASEGDLDQLTKMYASMKPKVAAQLFEQMTPEFAAGFLGRMPADAAGGILSGLPAEQAYAISVVLAGRNANAPKD